MILRIGVRMNVEYAEFVSLFVSAHVLLLVDGYQKRKGSRNIVSFPTLILTCIVSYTITYATYILLLTNSELVYDKTVFFLGWVFSGLSWKFLEWAYEYLRKKK